MGGREGGGKEGGEEGGAINFATDEGHRGAEVLQGSWELFFFMLICVSDEVNMFHIN